MLSIAQANAIKNALKNAGIELPPTEPIKPFPTARTTLREVSNAIMGSTKTNPYADPKVQTVLAEYHAANIGNLATVHHTQEQEKQARSLEESFPTFLEEIQEKFDHAAAEISKAAESISHLNDPSDIDLRTATPKAAHAATTAIQARETIIRLTHAWTALHRHTGQPSTQRQAERFLWGAIPKELITRYATRQINTFDPWDLARERIPFELATPSEANKRHDAMQKEVSSATAEREKRNAEHAKQTYEAFKNATNPLRS